jgi:arylsulfatase A-like enzyme/Flp pilus assembly protein TadD
MLMRARTACAFFLLLVLFLVSDTALAVDSSRATPLNVLLITIDTLRADRLGCYGSSDPKTPNIDFLASQGVLFRRAFAHTPTTLPSHANILFGLTPLAHGIHDNANFVASPKFLSLAEHLAGFGYATAAVVGAYPLDARFGLDQGFDLYDDQYGWQDFSQQTFVERPAEVVVSRGIQWLKTQRGPWFLWLHCFDPHTPYDPPAPFRGQYALKPYDGEVAYVDFALAPLIKHLREGGLLAKTIIILTADHGESLGEHGEKTHGYLAYNSTLWVPLIICLPGWKPARTDAKVGHIDIFPTVCEVLGRPAPPGLQGLSLLPLMQGRSQPKRMIYFESLYPYYSRGWAPLRGFISGDSKFMDSPIPELYDLGVDFEEERNLLNEGSLKEQKDRLEQFIQSQAKSGSGVEPPASPADQSSLEKLRSLGYVGGQQSGFKTAFGPEDDIKTLLPFSNRAEAALSLFREGKAEQAREELETILKEKKDVDIAYTALASIYKERGLPGRALDVLRQGMTQLPANYEIYLAYISTLQSAGRFDELIASAEEQRYPQSEHDPEIWNTLGAAYSSTANLEKAMAAYEKALSLDRDHLSAWNNLGTVGLIFYARTNDRRWFEKSLQCFESALRLDPESAQAYNGLGAAYRQAGDLDKAISFWEKAVEIDPGMGNALYNLGAAYLDRGEKSRSLIHLLKYKELFYPSLRPEEKARLEELIRRCRQ